MFSAERGSGAFLNGEKIQRFEDRDARERPGGDRISEPAPAPERQRPFLLPACDADAWSPAAGAAAIDLAYVACGRSDAFWEFGLNPWDMAAGIVLLEEAGGKTTDMFGKSAGVRSPHLLTSNGVLHAEITELFAQIFRGEYRYPMVEMALPTP